MCVAYCRCCSATTAIRNAHELLEAAPRRSQDAGSKLACAFDSSVLLWYHDGALPSSVAVTQQTLDLLSQVRILARQPRTPPNSRRNQRSSGHSANRPPVRLLPRVCFPALAPGRQSARLDGPGAAEPPGCRLPDPPSFQNVASRVAQYLELGTTVADFGRSLAQRTNHESS